MTQSQMGASNTPTCISAIRDAYKSCTKAPASSAHPLSTHTPVHLQAGPPLFSAALLAAAHCAVSPLWQGKASVHLLHCPNCTAAPCIRGTPAGGACVVPRGQRPQRDLPQACACSWGHSGPVRCCALSGRCASIRHDAQALDAGDSITLHVFRHACSITAILPAKLRF